MIILQIINDIENNNKNNKNAAVIVIILILRIKQFDLLRLIISNAVTDIMCVRMYGLMIYIIDCIYYTF